MKPQGAALFTAFVLAACGGDADRDGTSNRSTDAAAPDLSGPTEDAGTLVDSGASDGGAADTGALDGGTSDGGAADDGGQTIHTLSVQIAGTGTGTVVSEPAGIECGVTCSATFAEGTMVTLSAVPAAGSVLSEWRGDCSGSETCEVALEASRSVTAHFEPGFSPVLLSMTDKSPSDIVKLSADRLAADHLSLSDGGVRSERAIQPGSGVFYFEGTQAPHALDNLYAFGVASRSVPLDRNPGDTSQGLSVATHGPIFSGGAYLGGVDAATEYFGFVVDYTGTNPAVHVIGLVRGVPRVALSQTLTDVTSPLYIMLSGQRRGLGFEARINPGNDTVNFPFEYDPESILAQAGISVPAPLTLGWGQTHAELFDAPPSISVGPNQTINVGSSVTVQASATDPEDGDLTSSVLWEDLATPFGDRTSGKGGPWTVTLTEPGLHPLRASVIDSIGKSAEAVVNVTVVGTAPQRSVVELVRDSWTGDGIVLRSDNLAARYTVEQKSGIRANQGLLNGFQYFEIRRELGNVNIGGGLVTRTGFLDPYRIEDVPPSMSLNSVGGIWQNFMYRSPYEIATEYYGFAVDYRGVNPIVHVITLDADGNPTVEDSVEMHNCFVPIYPMIYGNPQGTPAGSFDNSINFGATPFAYDPRPALRAAGIDLTGFELGWGDANTP